MRKRVPLETREIIQNGRCPKVFQMSTRFLRTGVTYHTLHKIGSKSFIEVCMQQKRHIVGDNELKYLHHRIDSTFHARGKLEMFALVAVFLTSGVYGKILLSTLELIPINITATDGRVRNIAL